MSDLNTLCIDGNCMNIPVGGGSGESQFLQIEDQVSNTDLWTKNRDELAEYTGYDLNRDYVGLLAGSITYSQEVNDVQVTINEWASNYLYFYSATNHYEANEWWALNYNFPVVLPKNITNIRIGSTTYDANDNFVVPECINLNFWLVGVE